MLLNIVRTEERRLPLDEKRRREIYNKVKYILLLNKILLNYFFLCTTILN